MKLITWNINGLRSTKTGVKEILHKFNGDIVCFQETKISRNLLKEDVAVIDGFNSYFSFPKKQSGYSGVATYCCNGCTPKRAEEGLTGIFASQNACEVNIPKFQSIEHQTYDLQALDSEGRVMITYHDIQFDDKIRTLAVINVYCPRVDPEKPERHTYKMQFLELLKAKAHALQKDGCCVMILGDLNISHHAIDHCDPCDEKEFDASESRQWLTTFLEASDSLPKETVFIDAFRYLHPQKKEAFTCWNTVTGARQTNYGTRIDYFLISYSLLPLLNSCDILSDVHGSDHCPVTLNLTCTAIPSSQLPSICTRLWPEFSGKQQTLSNFVQKSNAISKSNSYEMKHKSPLKTTTPHKKSKTTTNSNKQKSIKNFFRMNQVEPSAIKISAFLNEDLKQKNEKLDKINTEELSSQESVNFQTVPSCTYEASSQSQRKQSDMWKSVLCGPPKPPLCSGHNKPCVLRTVKKEGLNLGRQFFVCAQPNGLSSNPEARCDFFKWATPAKRSVVKN